MELILYDSLLEMRASRGIVQDYSKPINNSGVVEPMSNYRIMLDMFRSDPIIFTAIDLTADMVTYNGYDFVGENERLIKDAKKRFENVLDFDIVLKNLLTQLLIFGDAYLELVYNQIEVIDQMEGKSTTIKNGVKQIHALDTLGIAIKYDEHGEIEGYVQRPYGNSVTFSNKNLPTWNAEEVVYFRMYPIGSRVYSYSQLEPAARAFNTRLYSNFFLAELFKNVHPKMVWMIKNANKEQREAFMQNLIRAKTNPAMDVVGIGEGKAEMLQYNFTSGLLDIIKDLRKEVVMTFRVPPHWIGDVDGANRGIGENVVTPFESKIQKIQQIVASYINKELMPKLGYSNLEFRFNPISLMSEKSILQNAQLFTTLGIEVPEGKEHPAITYLKEKGMKIPFGAEILNPSTQVQTDSAPSRQRENNQTDKMSSNINRNGVSEAGGAKLEKRQVASAA